MDKTVLTNYYDGFIIKTIIRYAPGRTIRSHYVLENGCTEYRNITHEQMLFMVKGMNKLNYTVSK